MKSITIGKFKFVKTWVFPSDVSKFLIQCMSRYGKNHWSEVEQCFIKEKFTHVFCGDSKLGDFRIDKDPERKPDLVADCLDLPEILGKNSQDHVIADPPWQINHRDRQLFSYALRDICKVGGVLIINSPWSPWCVGLDFLSVTKVMPHFNNYRDLTDWWILRKVK